MRAHLHTQQRVCRRAIQRMLSMCCAFIFEETANLTNVNLRVGELGLSSHHLQL